MTYVLFEKTQIASYTDVSALFCVVNKEDSSEIFWKYGLYGNLCWENGTSTLYLCGKYDHFTYFEFEKEDRIELIKFPQNTGRKKLEEYLDKGYFVMLPINTKNLGYTDVPYRHNVFLTGYERNEYIVFDYWTPGFNWKHERVDCDKLLEAVDFSNHETVQMIYVFKYNAEYEANEPTPQVSQIENIYGKLWKNNPEYDYLNNVYGINIYDAMAQHIQSIDKMGLIDCQNLHVLMDHLQFTSSVLARLFSEVTGFPEIVARFDELITRANGLRNTAYKYYMTQRDIGGKRERILEELLTIRDIEQQLTDSIIAGSR